MLSELSDCSASSDNQEILNEDVKKEGRDDASETYGESFESLSSKASTLTSTTSKSGSEKSSGRRKGGSLRGDSTNREEGNANAEAAPVSQDRKTSDEHVVNSRGSRVNNKKKVTGSSGNARKTSKRKKSRGKEVFKSISTLSTIYGDDTTPRSTTGGMESMIQRLKKRKYTPQGGESQVPAGNSHASPQKTQKEINGVDSGGEPITVNTTEELSNLLAKNDELRMRLFENGRAGKYSNGHQRNKKVDNKRSTHEYRRLQKSTMAVETSMRREQNRQELRGEREKLISLRNELRRKLAANKQLHVYYSLIEDCKADIARLLQEKRALSLVIRQNEKVLINSEAQHASDLACRRLREEIKAESVLTQRSLERARRDAFEAVKMYGDAEFRAKKLEEQLERANNKEKTQEVSNDPDVRKLVEENQRKAQHIQQLRGQLRRMRSKSSTNAIHGSSEASKREAKNERAGLLKRINRLRKRVEELTAKVNEQKAHGEAEVSADSDLNAVGPADDPKKPSMQKRHFASANESLTVQEKEAQGESTLIEEPSRMSEGTGLLSSNTSCEHTQSSVDKALEELKRRVGETRLSVETPATEQRSSVTSTPGAAGPAPDHTSVSEDLHALSEKLAQPSLTDVKNDTASTVKDEGELESATSGEKEMEKSEKKDEKSTVPSWFDNDDASNGDEPHTGTGNSTNEVGLPVSGHNGVKDAGIHKNSLAEAPASTGKTASLQAEEEEEEDDVYAEIDENKLTGKSESDAKVESDVVPPSPKNEPSWLDFD
ncbi:hypothetical protein C3747_121g84 [Trypanosoma cruzi]|uniref:Uncharacterized protein n=2 Tax=Trypanosoma cruzi TaxID=5693 RepID=Q4DTD7_TRYCC|nr:hypothetical protein, conserved [Trypanosoma cruzi]EAN95782.1 hypothetical protein, conserved [Trypanosoma cruzi]PWV06041.1 hypothetical protein C3747_121g84 [Trypanosoma cruzi]RNC54911.1 hypothetical protein TcCL_ESM07652 [Trypanosoma cruzi]|eukprot:XP_817633.1 hypothetical protein [Trypanosoma cruzi strain CL Brener]